MTKHHYNLCMLLDEVFTAFAGRPALRYAEEELSYRDLDQLSGQLATLLLARGLRQGDVIAIGHNKRPLSYALMLAALRLGIPYVNVDVASPLPRNLLILQTARPALMFFDDEAYREQMAELAAAYNGPLLLLERDALPPVSAEERTRLADLARTVDGASIAYVMFTSGSTGTPKGVAVTHQNVLHFIAWGQSCFSVSAADVFANLSPMYFDNSVFDFYVGLFSGAALAPVYRDVMAKPYDLVAHVRSMGCTIWFSVPSLLIYLTAMKAMAAEALPSLRAIVFGGEGYPKVELKKLYTKFSPQAQLVNVYGPTECTCICSAYTLTDTDFADLEGLPTLGYLNQNFDYRILDADEKDAESGELCLIGPNVAAGYFNDPTRTNAAFHTLTDARRYMKRMYRTGDLVREEEGRLYFVGRKDNQIKHMGYRIELEEIEHALAKIPHVNRVAVLYQRSQTAYGKIIGFVSSTEALDDKVVLAALGKLVPDYMVPSRLLVMPDLPKNPNGKVDRHKLKALLEKEGVT